MQWLKSGEAIQVHALFAIAIVLLTSQLLSGNRGPAGDYLLGLVFCVVAYPIVLFLLWLRWRGDGGVDIATPNEPPSWPHRKVKT